MNEINTRGDLNLFRVMLTIAEEGSTVRAANRLHLSQSAVSHALKRLREMLNDPVFVKSGRKLVLTPHGKTILPNVKRSIETLSACNAKSGVFEPASSELQLSLGFRDILEFLILPELLCPLRDEGSQVRIETKRVVLNEIDSSLLTDKLDLIIDLDIPVDNRISSIEVSREHLCALVGRKHPSFDSGRISSESYSASSHALVTLNRRERAFVDQRISSEGLQRKVLLHCEHYLPAVRAVAHTDLVLTMPFSYAYHLAQYEDVRMLSLPFAIDPFPIRMYWRRDMTNEPYMEWILPRLKNIFDQQLPRYEDTFGEQQN